VSTEIPRSSRALGDGPPLWPPYAGRRFALVSPAEIERLRTLAEWLVSMDDSDNREGLEARRTVTLTQIIDRARAALAQDGTP
jgi:hypothetical protein